MIGSINNYIQRRLQIERLDEVPLSTAAKWLEEVGILKDSRTSPGYPLRRHIHRGNIFNVYRKNNYFWFIKRIDNYSDILSANELKKIFGLKNRTSVYRKMREQQIPFERLNQKGIYFKTLDVLHWAMEANRLDIVEKIRNNYSVENLKGDIKQVKDKITKNAK